YRTCMAEADLSVLKIYSFVPKPLFFYICTGLTHKTDIEGWKGGRRGKIGGFRTFPPIQSSSLPIPQAK
ncbi:MAG: hypothetical protein OXU27_12825, partial [Candidatus Poribacteria bacterium]|nr:hypothetical protein [Candidatus Poribacteria bacterium]